ncbi:hypothetical protein C7967_11559 [Thalassospira sp. 11-3]|nr:hypothetical protein C7967_11559 [Thalassospira sp. 11-3]
MKKLIVLLFLLLGVAMNAQIYTGYQRHGKKTTAEIGDIDVSNTNVIYTAYDTTLGIEVINTGSGWVPRITAGGTIDAIPTDGSNNAVSSNGVFDQLALKAGLSGNNSFTGTNSFNKIYIDGNLGAGAYSMLTMRKVSSNSLNIIPHDSDFANIYVEPLGSFTVAYNNGSDDINYTFYTQYLTNSRTYTLPDATGTLALTSDLGSYLPLGGGQMAGNITYSSNAYAIGNTTNALGALYARWIYHEPVNPATRSWKTTSNSSNNQLAFEAETAAGSDTHALMYSLNVSGTPIIATDLTDKAYVDSVVNGDATTLGGRSSVQYMWDNGGVGGAYNWNTGPTANGTYYSSNPSDDINAPFSTSSNSTLLNLKGGTQIAQLAVDGTPGNNRWWVRSSGNSGSTFSAWKELGTDDQTASEVPITDAGDYFTGTTLETVTQEIGASIESTIQMDPNSPEPITGFAKGTTEALNAAGLDPNTIGFPTDATNNLVDIDDVGTATPTDKHALMGDGDSWESRALVKADISDFNRDASFGVSLSNTTTAITTGTAKETIKLPYAMTVTGVYASVATVSSSGVVTVDINEGGTSILSTKLTIDASEKGSDTAATPAVISDSSIAQYGELTFDIDTAGTGAVNLKVWVIGTKN